MRDGHLENKVPVPGRSLVLPELCGGLFGPYWRPSRVLDRRRSGQDGPRLAASLLMRCENSIFKKTAFRLGESVILGPYEAKMELRWDPVGLCWAWIGPMLLYVGRWLLLVPADAMLDLCRPMQAFRSLSDANPQRYLACRGLRLRRVKGGGATFLAGSRLDIYM